ncbi:LysE family translocator [Roseivirga sp. BDSF3-8]|uniref:LysE family translocator n=1 Tax=Roseivirga sp. BDSF3-8 TaxID=3241598 RepID=UPI0035319760
MDALLQGILMGLLLAALVGPVFFSLIQTSISKGMLAGVCMALGISISDSLYILITYYGVSRFMDSEGFQMFLGAAGGAIMLIFGIVYLIKPTSPNEGARIRVEKGTLTRQVVKGFLLNGINPFVLLFWVGIMSMARLNLGFSSADTVTFFAAIVGTVFLTDILKSWLANLLQSVVTPRFMKIMNRVVGVLLIGFSLRLFLFAAAPGF